MRGTARPPVAGPDPPSGAGAGGPPACSAPASAKPAARWPTRTAGPTTAPGATTRPPRSSPPDGSPPGSSNLAARQGMAPPHSVRNRPPAAARRHPPGAGRAQRQGRVRTHPREAPQGDRLPPRWPARWPARCPRHRGLGGHRHRRPAADRRQDQRLRRLGGRFACHGFRMSRATAHPLHHPRQSPMLCPTAYLGE